MNRQYQIEHQKQKQKAGIFGVILACGLHLLLVLIFSLTGFDYIYPPPPEEQDIFIELDELVENKRIQEWTGRRPQAMTSELDDPNLVQRAEAELEGTKANKAQETMVDEFGDVEVKKHEQEIDKRGLFNVPDNKSDIDTLAPQTSIEPDGNLKAGHASGNVRDGSVTGEPTARLRGRSIKGSLPRPAYNIQAEGTVVVEISVNAQGRVVKAVPGYEGTTVNDKNLWEAARKAAMNAQFNQVDTTAPTVKGTITYIFKLRQ